MVTSARRISLAEVTPLWMFTVTTREVWLNSAVAVPLLIVPVSTTLTITPVSVPPRSRSLEMNRSLFAPGRRSCAVAATPSTPPLEASSGAAMALPATVPKPVLLNSPVSVAALQSVSPFTAATMAAAVLTPVLSVMVSVLPAKAAVAWFAVRLPFWTNTRLLPFHVAPVCRAVMTRSLKLPDGCRRNVARLSVSPFPETSAPAGMLATVTAPRPVFE